MKLKNLKLLAIQYLLLEYFDKIKTECHQTRIVFFLLIFRISCYFMHSPAPVTLARIWAHIWGLYKYNSLHQSGNELSGMCLLVLYNIACWGMTHTQSHKQRQVCCMSAESRSLELWGSTRWNGKWPGGRDCPCENCCYVCITQK